MNKTDLEHINCEICGLNNEEELSTKDRDGNYLRTVICKNCGLIYTNPRPARPEIEKYYAHEYRLEYKGAFRPRKKHVYRAARVAVDRIGKIKEFMIPGMKALDIGSGGGEVVYAMHLTGLKSEGLEPNIGYASYARDTYGLKISIGGIEATRPPEKNFDLVTMFHVIEHLYKPSAALQNVHFCLRDGGIFAVECPNAEARCQAPDNRTHKAHLYNFNQAALRHLVEKCGFKLLRMKLSSDGGNILAVFRKEAGAPLPYDLSGNYKKVKSQWESYSYTGYLSTPYPYKKLLMKLFRIINEAWITIAGPDELTLLKKITSKYS